MKLSPSRAEVKNALSFASIRPLVLDRAVRQIFLLRRKYALRLEPLIRTLVATTLLCYEH